MTCTRTVRIKNTNTPPGHTFKLWTVNELLEMGEWGEMIINGGDRSRLVLC